MKPMSTSARAHILFLSKSGLSARKISSQTGLGKSTVARVIKEIHPGRKNIKLGPTSKLSPTDKRRIVSSIITGKVENAVQATHLINSTLSPPVFSQNIHNMMC